MPCALWVQRATHYIEQSHVTVLVEVLRRIPQERGGKKKPAEIEAILQLRQLSHHDDYPRAAFVNGWIISFRYRFTDHLSLSYKKKKEKNTVVWIFE